MKLVNSNQKMPDNIVQFQTSTEMTHFDVKNYLEKIYGVSVVEVKVDIVQGKTRKAQGRHYIVKDDDYKVATVTLPRNQVFRYPALFPAEKKEELKDIEAAEQKHQEYVRRNSHRPGIPGWFSM